MKRCLTYLLGLRYPTELSLVLSIFKMALIDHDMALFSEVSLVTMNDACSIDRALIVKMIIQHDRAWAFERLLTLGWRPNDGVFEVANEHGAKDSMIFLLDHHSPSDPDLILAMLEKAISSKACSQMKTKILTRDMIIIDRLLLLSSNHHRDSIARIAISYDRVWPLESLQKVGWKPGDDAYEAAIPLDCLRGEDWKRASLNYLLGLGLPEKQTLSSAILKASVELGWLDEAKIVMQRCTDRDRNDTSHTLQAASKGDINMLTLLHEQKWKWDQKTYLASVLGKSRECFDYARCNGCPDHRLPGMLKDLPRITEKKASKELLRNWIKDEFDNETVVRIMPPFIVMNFAFRCAHIYDAKKKTFAEFKQSTSLPFVWEKVDEILEATRPYIWSSLGFPSHICEDVREMVWDRIPGHQIHTLYSIARKAACRKSV